MTAVWFRVGVWVRRRSTALIGTAVIIGVLGGVALALAAGTRRTASAPDRYSSWAGGDPELLVVQQSGRPLTERIADLPGVTDAEGYSFVLSFPVSPTDGTTLEQLNPFAGDDDAVGARVVEGRFVDPDEPDEFTVNVALADELERRFGTEVGDSFEFASFSIDQVRGDVDPEDEEPTLEPFTATLVGITEAPRQFDEPNAELVLSQALLDAHPDIGIVQTLIAVHLRHGGDPNVVLDAVHAMDDGVDAYAVSARIVSDSARRAVRYQVLALWLVSGLALAAAAVVAAQVAARALRVGDDERAAMASVGWRRRDLAAERAIEGSFIGLLAVPVAAVIGAVGTRPFPLGVLATFEPDPGVRLDLLVLCVGLPALVAVVAAAGAYAGVRGARSFAHRTTLPATAPPVPAGAGMPLVVGMHFATSTTAGRRPWRTTVVGALGGAGLVGSVVTGFALTTIVDTPARWGVNFDSMFGNPYTYAPGDIVTPLLADPAVVAATGANLGSVTVDGEDTPTVAFSPAKGDLAPTVLEGRVPEGDDEIALGAETARAIGAAVGDDVEVEGVTGETFPMEVVGLAVVPGNAGAGAVLTFDAYERANPEATQHVVMVRFAPDASAADIDRVVNTAFSPPDSLPTPVSVRALERVTAAPFLLAGVFALMLLVSGAYLFASSVRGRSHDLATLRALGAHRRQVRAVVRWQALLVTGAMVVVGVPLGILTGRFVVRSVTSALGIVPTIDLPAWLVAASVVVPFAVAALLAIVPAHQAARADVARLTRDR